MGDIKLFAKNEKELEILIQVIRIYIDGMKNYRNNNKRDEKYSEQSQSIFSINDAFFGTTHNIRVAK